MPPYRQLATILRERVLAGTYTGRIPSARTLGQEFGVAVGTVRKALGLLHGEGLTEPHQGWGVRILGPEERGKG